MEVFIFFELQLQSFLPQFDDYSITVGVGVTSTRNTDTIPSSILTRNTFILNLKIVIIWIITNDPSDKTISLPLTPRTEAWNKSQNNISLDLTCRCFSQTVYEHSTQQGFDLSAPVHLTSSAALSTRKNPVLLQSSAVIFTHSVILEKTRRTVNLCTGKRASPSLAAPGPATTSTMGQGTRSTNPRLRSWLSAVMGASQSVLGVLTRCVIQSLQDFSCVSRISKKL